MKVLPPEDRIQRGCPGTTLPRPVDGDARPTAFLDRDGVLNVDRGFVHEISEFEWVPGAQDAVQMLKDLGWWVVVVTNQSGAGLGLYPEEDVISLSKWILEQVEVDLITYCPHKPELACPARKPGTGLLDTAAQVLPIDASRSFLIGDKPTDLQAGESFGVRSYDFRPDEDLLALVKRAVSESAS